MKNLFSFFIIYFASITLLFAQTPPEAFKYQAVLRGIDGKEIINKAVKLRVTILKGAPTGVIAHRETHNATTNAFGLVNVNIGKGTAVSGIFSTINWSDTTHYVNLEVDPAGGNSFTNMGTTQLLSVPYALCAKSIPFVKVSEHNAFIGEYSANYNTTGDYNTFLGYYSGYKNTTGNENTFVGSSAGRKNTTGKGNTYIGYDCGIGLTTSTDSFNVCIGYKAGNGRKGSNKLYIANSNADSANALIFGNFNTKCVTINQVLRLKPSATPSNPTEGTIYMDGSTHKLRVYASGSWHDCW